MADIQIGKFTLESLTTGMYNDPEIVYREYIQNAVDSFDNAVNQKLMSYDDCRIEIIIDASRQEISIKDNGAGISQDLAQKTLLDIGNSNKKHTNNRGFRGIGRLGGLSYCKRLSFCTTAQNENTKTVITFDCDKLKKLLVPGENQDYDLQRVISEVTDVKILSEQVSAHYFIVKMEGVDDIETLLDIDYVKDYIAQIAPVPFRDRFYWSKKIKSNLRENGYNLAEYSVFIGNSFENLSQIFKPYKLAINISSRASESKDEIQGISFFDIKDEEDKLLAIGWYGELNFLGTISDELIAGIRIRQGNILIGDSNSLSPLFIESRFNHWCLGEIYIVSKDLIPNARRDGFENNKTYNAFCNAIKDSIGIILGNKIRQASKARNNPMQKAINKTAKTIQKTKQVLESGFNSTFEKKQIAEDLVNARKSLYVIAKDAPIDILSQKNDLMEEITELTTEVDESKNFKTRKNISSDFSKSEKKIIQSMLEVLTRNFERSTVDDLYNQFLEEIKKKG